MKWPFVILLTGATIATGLKACSNALFVEGHPNSHVKPVSPQASRKIGSFISELQPAEDKLNIKGKDYIIDAAWVEYRTKLTHFLVWLPRYVRTEGIHVTLQLNETSLDDEIPFWIELKDGHYTYLSNHQFTGMSKSEPQNQYEFLITDRLTKERIGSITLHNK